MCVNPLVVLSLCLFITYISDALVSHLFFFFSIFFLLFFFFSSFFFFLLLSGASAGPPGARGPKHMLIVLIC